MLINDSYSSSRFWPAWFFCCCFFFLKRAVPFHPLGGALQGLQGAKNLLSFCFFPPNKKLEDRMLQQHQFFFSPGCSPRGALQLGHQLSTQERTRNGWFLHFVLAWRNGNTFPALKSYQNFFLPPASPVNYGWEQMSLKTQFQTTETEQKTERQTVVHDGVCFICNYSDKLVISLTSTSSFPLFFLKLSWLGRRDVFPVPLDSLHRFR